MSAQDPMDYRTVTQRLRAEGFDIDDIDAAIDSLIDSGITYADEDETLLTAEEVDVLRDQLATTDDGDEPVADGVMSTGQVAEALGVTRRTVTNWCLAARIDSYQTPGGHWRIPVSAVDAVRHEMGS